MKTSRERNPFILLELTDREIEEWFFNLEKTTLVEAMYPSAVSVATSSRDESLEDEDEVTRQDRRLRPTGSD